MVANILEPRKYLGRISFLIIGLLSCAFIALAQYPAEAVRQLELQQKGKIVRLRHLVSDSTIRYDQTGKLVSKGNPGRWTWNSSVQVTGVEMKGGVLKVKANRLLLNYQRSIHQFNPLLIGEKVEIDIETSKDSGGNIDLLQEWRKAFLRPEENYPEQIQPYWRPFIECLLNPKTDTCEYYENESWKPDIYDVKGKSKVQSTPLYPGVERVGGGVSAPKIKSKVEPVYTTVASQAGIQGTVMLEGIIDKEGALTVKRVIRPLGWGLEESAAEALAKWKFEPARRDSQAVAVVITVEINFAKKP